MTTEITLSEFEWKNLIRQHLATKGFNFKDAESQFDCANYTIKLVGTTVKVTINDQ